MTNKLSYMHKVCSGMEKSAFATLLIFYLFLAKWTAVHNLVVLSTSTLSHIIATRLGLDLSSMTCIFIKLIDLCETWPKLENAHEKFLAPRVSNDWAWHMKSTQCFPYQAVTSKIYPLTEHFLLPATVRRFTIIK